jgi:hypothetical protein
MTDAQGLRPNSQQLIDLNLNGGLLAGEKLEEGGGEQGRVKGEAEERMNV